MSFLNQNNAEFLSARLTQKGRRSIAQGDFKIKFFQIGDSEFDYADPFINLDGITVNPQQNVFAPLDKDSQVKYPYKLNNSEDTTTYGVPMMDSITETIRNGMGPAGFVTEYKEYDEISCSGTTIECNSIRLPLSGFTGTNTITFTEVLDYGDCDGVTQSDIDLLNIHSFNGVEFITVAFGNELLNEDQVITGNSMSLIYRVTNITTITGSTTTPSCDEIITGQTTLTLDRNTPDLSSVNGYAQIIRNSCKIENPIGSETSTVCVSNQVDPSEQHDPWKLNVVWQEKPIGSDVDGDDENISGYTSSKHISTMEYLGYGLSDGQVSNTGTTYNNSFGENIIVSPEEQKCIAVIHYSELGHIFEDPERFFKYDDYIGSSTTEGVLVDEDVIYDTEFFNVYIPFIHYENSTGTTIGAEFKMDETDYYIDSTVAGAPGDIRTKYIKYRYLLDEIGEKVGKVFIDKKIIVFDNQELVALLDYRSNRRFTLPTPKVYHVPSEGIASDSCFIGTTGQTYWVTYMFTNDDDNQLNSLPCNNFTKVEVNIVDGECTVNYPSNIAIKWGGEDNLNGVGSFQHLKSNFNDVTNGYIADKLWILIQETTDEVNKLPDPSQWLKIDITNKIPNHTVGDLIEPENLRDFSFIVSGADVEDGTLFDLEDFLENNPSNDNYLGDTVIEPTSIPQFGDEQPFPGSVKLVRCSDIEEMRFLVNLPHTQWNETQNPTYNSSQTNNTKYVTEVALLDQNKNVLVNAKTSTPVKRVGTQVFSIKLDF